MLAKVSIITINYNNNEGLVKTIESVITQTFTNFEFILIDGGSNDGSVETIRQYNHRIDFWVSEKDKGIYNAMNKGIQLATGDYVFFLNAGDFFYDDNVLTQVEKYSQQYNTGILYGNVWDVDSTGMEMKRPKWLLGKITLFRRMICHQSIFAKRSLFAEYGLFDEQYKIKADYDWLLKVICAGATHKYININVAKFNDGGVSATAYNTVSVHEIPVIRNKYFTAAQQKKIRRFFINPTITKTFPWHLRSEKLLRWADQCIA